jgi:hypothetical protein
MEFEIVDAFAVDDKLMKLNVRIEDTILTVLIRCDADEETIAKEVKRYYEAYLEEKRREEMLKDIEEQMKEKLNSLKKKKMRIEIEMG